MKCKSSVPGNCLGFLVLGLIFLVLANQALGEGLEEARHRGRLIVGVKTDFPPFGYVDQSGAPAGLEVDMARHLAKELSGGDEDTLELVPVTTGSRIPFLYSNWIDVIMASMTITEDRARVLEFSEPYLFTGSMLLVGKDSPVTGPEDLAGKNVAVVERSVQEKDLVTVAPQVTTMKFGTVEEAILALKEKRVDAFCEDAGVILYLAHSNAEFKTVGKPFIPHPYSIAVKKGDEKFIRWINMQLNTMMADGTYRALWQKYFGDIKPEALKP